MIAQLSALDAVVFTARAVTISPDGTGTAVLVVPTDEEREIARQVPPVVATLTL